MNFILPDNLKVFKTVKRGLEIITNLKDAERVKRQRKIRILPLLQVSSKIELQ